MRAGPTKRSKSSVDAELSDLYNALSERNQMAQEQIRLRKRICRLTAQLLLSDADDAQQAEERCWLRCWRDVVSYLKMKIADDEENTETKLILEALLNEGVRYYSKLASKLPEAKGVLLALLFCRKGDCYRYNHDLDEARVEYLRALKADPGDGQAQNQLGICATKDVLEQLYRYACGMGAERPFAGAEVNFKTAWKRHDGLQVVQIGPVTCARRMCIVGVALSRGDASVDILGNAINMSVSDRHLGSVLIGLELLLRQSRQNQEMLLNIVEYGSLVELLNSLSNNKQEQDVRPVGSLLTEVSMARGCGFDFIDQAAASVGDQDMKSIQIHRIIRAAQRLTTTPLQYDSHEGQFGLVQGHEQSLRTASSVSIQAAAPAASSGL